VGTASARDPKSSHRTAPWGSFQLQDTARTVAWFQITFTDLDEAAYGAPPGQLTPFSHLGLVDLNLSPKPALSTWDAIFARPRR
jgi:hypothetical protein